MTMLDRVQYETLFAEERAKDGCHYRYRLLSRTENNENYYSIAADMKTNDNKETSAMVYDVFRSLDEAQLFFNRIIRLLATPINLPYVVEDEVITLKK